MPIALLIALMLAFASLGPHGCAEQAATPAGVHVADDATLAGEGVFTADMRRRLAAVLPDDARVRIKDKLTLEVAPGDSEAFDLGLERIWSFCSEHGVECEPYRDKFVRCVRAIVDSCEPADEPPARRT